MKQVLGFLKKEMMLTLSMLAAAAALFITPPSARLLEDIDWQTLGTLLMMLCVLERSRNGISCRSSPWRISPPFADPC